MASTRKHLVCSQCGRRVSLRQRSAWPSPGGPVCKMCGDATTLEVRERGRSMLKSFGLAPAEYFHAIGTGESLALQAYREWQDDGAAIGRPLNARAVVAGLRYALFLAEERCGPVAAKGRVDKSNKKKRRPAARRGRST